MRMRTRKTLTALVGLLALAGALAACGDDSSDDGDTAQRSQAEPDQAADGAADEPEAPPTVEVAQTGLGQVLVDAESKTLYLFANDQGTTTGVSDSLQQAWPPLTVESEEDVVAGEGVDGGKLATAQQADGRLWVTYNDHLLYRFSGDGAPGDTNGHALGNIWFALTPDGEQVTG
jgi:predicted lipoprotein with Yx(FWY)xxD motif